MKNIYTKKREGFALVLALIIVAVGLIVIAAMFSSVSTFTSYFSTNRQAYVDTVTARNFIEMMKGELVAENIARRADGRPVLHGTENMNADFSGPITKLEGLLVTGDSGEFVRNHDVNITGPQKVEVRVYDANYRVDAIDQVAFPHNEIYELPPSFYQGGFGAAEPDYSLHGNDGTYEPDEELQEELMSGAYENYGAYLIRVRIFNTASGNNKYDKLVRTTEEAFFHRIPSP